MILNSEYYPKVTKGIVHRGENRLYGYYGWPSVCSDENGILYAVCSGFRMAHICPFGKTVLFKSFDNGKSWGPPCVINDTPNDDRDAGIINLGGGRLLVTWFSHPSENYSDLWYDEIKKMCGDGGAIAAAQIDHLATLPRALTRGGSFIRISRDSGESFGSTITLPVSSPHGPSLMRDGRRLVYLGKEMYSESEAPGAVACYESRDGGESWERLSCLDIPEGLSPSNFHEPHAAELPDGSLFGAVRAQGKGVYNEFTFYLTRSIDNGYHWSPLEPSGISGSPPHILLHSSGTLILSYGRREPPYGIRALVSRDFGATFEEYVLSDDSPDGDLGYPCTVETPGGELLTVYYGKYGSDSKCSIMYLKWSL